MVAPRTTAALVVTYNSAEQLPSLLQDLLAAQAADVLQSIVVVDNASTDSTVSIARGSCPSAEVVERPHNEGYAAAINVGMSRIPEDWDVLVLNPDVRISPDAINCLKSRTTRKVGILVPQLHDDSGTLSPSLRREPTLSRALGDAFFGRRWQCRPGLLSETVWPCRSNYERRQTVDWATGAVLLLSSRCRREVGAWDEKYFLYSEETDYARRCREAQLAVVYVPEAVAVHSGAGSGTSASLAALVTVNRVRYYAARHGAGKTMAFRLLVLLGVLLRGRAAGSFTSTRALLRPLPTRIDRSWLIP